MKNKSEKDRISAVLFIIVFLLGCLGKLKQTNDRIDELKEPVVVATVNIDNGYGAGYLATQINRLAERNECRSAGGKE